MLILKSINDLLGEHFYIPHYQRGYRWTPQQVNDLLNDIWAFYTDKKGRDSEFYCLQPIVTKPKQWIENGTMLNGWEVIDGQQRLTTLNIILNYLTKEHLKVESLKEEYGKEIFSVRYETRPESAEYLKKITDNVSNIDLYHMTSAYNTVKDWFASSEKAKDRTDRNRFLDTLLGKKDDERSVQVIWYNVDSDVNGIELFTRLNIGKIPLTNAELVKALFLSSSSFAGDTKAELMKLEIAQIWDEIEQKLGEDAFWSFISNKPKSEYPTKIELLLDLISSKKFNEFDPYYTFLYFLEASKYTEKLWDLWLKIEHYYLTLIQWYKDKDYYHKVGYLIATGVALNSLIDLSTKIKKRDFQLELDNMIREEVKDDIHELRYDTDRKKIENLLLLFNVESTRLLKSNTEYYPFHFHKKNPWTLEHIHAQNPENITQNKKEAWIKWLAEHKQVIEDMAIEDKTSSRIWESLKGKVDSVDDDTLTREKFEGLANEIMTAFSENTQLDMDIHSISNLALLTHSDNAVLKNAVFEVKRRAIIELDRKGSYIPICTRRVFLKYYNDKPSNQQYYYWSRDDRNSYMKEIESVLNDYLHKT